MPSTPERIVVIGFGPVAASLAEGLLPGVADGRIHLTVVSAEKHVAYNRVLLAELAVGATEAEHLSMVDEQRLRQAGRRCCTWAPRSPAWTVPAARCAWRTAGCCPTTGWFLPPGRGR